MPKIETIIFDLDGVIIDSEPIHFKIEEEIFAEVGITIPQAEHFSYVGTSSINMWDIIIRKYGLNADPVTLANKGRLRYMEYLTEQKELFPIKGVSEFIKDLDQNNFKLIVASSSHKEVIDKVLERFHLSDYFLTTISGTQFEFSKPHPGIFLSCAGMVDCEPCKCIVIEDSENGVKAAKAAEMKCIGYQNPNSGVQDLTQADLIIHSFLDINAEKIKLII